jgi:hypothetical protein
MTWLLKKATTIISCFFGMQMKWRVSSWVPWTLTLLTHDFWALDSTVAHAIPLVILLLHLGNLFGTGLEPRALCLLGKHSIT